MRQAAFKGLREDKPAAEVEAIVPAVPPQAVAESEPAKTSTKAGKTSVKIRAGRPA